MTEIQEIKNLLQQHMRESADDRIDIKQSIARIEVHNEYTQKKLEVVDKLEKSNQRQKGALWVLSLIGLGGIEEFIRHLAK